MLLINVVSNYSSTPKGSICRKLKVLPLMDIEHKLARYCDNNRRLNGEAKAEGLIHGRTCCWDWFVWCSMSGRLGRCISDKVSTMGGRWTMARSMTLPDNGEEMPLSLSLSLSLTNLFCNSTSAVHMIVQTEVYWGDCR